MGMSCTSCHLSCFSEDRAVSKLSQSAFWSQQDLPVRPSTHSSDETEAEVEGPIPVETVSTMKLAVSPQISSLGEASRDPNSATHPNTSSAGKPESSDYVGN